ncbi:MAG: hypothetical protein EPN36_15860 [Rhodanobacteraceae bacterium]|nr:MAG: hypothetical protein EPN36_15860 [Rhodanobacteraceae bacterium]
MDLRNRRRLQAGLIVAIFAAPVLVMLGLALAGWVPRGRSYGQHLQPERNLASMPVRMADGKPFAFDNHAAVWTLVALPGPDCAQRCLRKLDMVHRAQITLGQHADKLRLLYLGTPPTSDAAKGFAGVWTLATTPSHALADLRADARDSVSAVLVTPDGMALTRYAAGFDPEGLRQDLKKVVH